MKAAIVALCIMFSCSLAQAQMVRDRLFGNISPRVRGEEGRWKVLPGLTGGLKLYDLYGRYHATLNGTGGTTTSGLSYTDRKGGTGQLSLDGTNDYADTSSVPAGNYTSSDFSVLFWIKPTSLGANETIVFKGAWQTEGWEIQHNGGGNGSGQLSLLTSQSGTAQEIESATGYITVGNWSFVVVTRTGTVGKIYHNGVEVSYLLQQSITNPASSTKTLQFGRDEAAGLYIAAGLDDIRISNVALTAMEVEKQYVMESQSYNVRTPTTFMSGVLPNLGAQGSFFRFMLPQGK